MINRCPACSSPKVSKDGRHPTLLFILFWPWTLFLMRVQYHCRDCKAKWKA